MPGTIAPPRYSPAAEMASKVVAVPRSTTMIGGENRSSDADRVGDPVGTDLFRVVVEDRHAGPDARLDDDERHVEPARGHLAKRHGD